MTFALTLCSNYQDKLNSTPLDVWIVFLNEVLKCTLILAHTLTGVKTRIILKTLTTKQNKQFHVEPNIYFGHVSPLLSRPHIALCVFKTRRAGVLLFLPGARLWQRLARALSALQCFLAPVWKCLRMGKVRIAHTPTQGTSSKDAPCVRLWLLLLFISSYFICLK